MLVDSHAHLNFHVFENDLPEVIQRCRVRGMKVVNVGSQLETSQKAVDMAHAYDGFFAAVGLHPVHLGESSHDLIESREHQSVTKASLPEIFNQISVLARDQKVVAIGETGLDYFCLGDAKDCVSVEGLQKEYFLKQLALAQENNLPVILHCRGRADNPQAVYEEILEIIKDKNLTGVIHCFGSNLAIAKKFVDLGFYIGITGIITFGKKARDLEEVARVIPLAKILIETDCPYLAPEPHRGARNEPVFVEFIAKKIADLKRMDLAEVIEITGQNAQRLFNI